MTRRVPLPSDTPSSHLEQLVYVSDDIRGVTSALQVEDIMVLARQNNARDGITGALAFTDGRFVQVLEGRPADLENLLERLISDDRHTNLTILARRGVQARDFLGWDMVSPRLAPAELLQMRALLAQPDAVIDAYVDVLAQAVARQADILAENGFVPHGAIDKVSSARS